MTDAKHYTLAFIIVDTCASLTVVQQPDDPNDVPNVRQYRTEYPKQESPASYPSDEMLYLWQQFHADIIASNVGAVMAREELDEYDQTTVYPPAHTGSPHNAATCLGRDTCPYCSPISETQEEGTCPDPKTCLAGGNCLLSDLDHDDKDETDIPPPSL